MASNQQLIAQLKHPNKELPGEWAEFTRIAHLRQRTLGQKNFLSTSHKKEKKKKTHLYSKNI